MPSPNTLMTLNGYLFEQLDRLNDPELKGDELRAEVERAEAVTGVAQQIISNANTVLKAANMPSSMGQATARMLVSGEANG